MNIFSRLDNLTDLTTNEQTLVDYMKIIQNALLI